MCVNTIPKHSKSLTTKTSRYRFFICFFLCCVDRSFYFDFLCGPSLDRQIVESRDLGNSLAHGKRVTMRKRARIVLSFNVDRRSTTRMRGGWKTSGTEETYAVGNQPSIEFIIVIFHLDTYIVLQILCRKVRTILF